LLLRACADERVGLCKEDIGTKSFRRNDFAIVEIGTVEVRVVPHIGSLSDTASAMPKNFRKTTVFGTIGIIVTEVPFPEHAGLVTSVGKHLTDGNFVLTQHRTSHDGVPNPSSIRPVSGE
jgi:hypothetical protein